MILALNCGLATIAGAVNLWAARHRRATSLEARTMRRIRGLMALAYAAVMALDLTNQIGATTRVSWVQAFGLFAWPVVWLLPALVTIPPAKTADTMTAASNRLAAEVARRLQEPSA